MEPTDAVRENVLPIEVAWLEARPRFVGAVVEDHRRTNAVTAVAVDGGDVRPGDTVVGETLVERLDAHSPDALGHQVADRVIDHGRGDAELIAEAVGEVVE